jgi:uncharacterized paraquat-inducible protein A
MTQGHKFSEGTVDYTVSAWAFLLFLAAADCELPPLVHFLLFQLQFEVVMILRIYAMWDQSKRILGALLFIYVPEVVIAFIFTGIYNSPYFSGMSPT